MFFSSWFFGKFRVNKPALSKRERQLFSSAHRPVSNDMNRSREPALKIQESREALYETIREVMTRTGILSASYKFKVLSLDRQGSSYLAMIDLTSVTSDTVLHPPEMEKQIIQRAMIAHQITVSAVYWRFHEMAAVHKAFPSSIQAASVLPDQLANRKKSPLDNVRAEDIAAFQTAMLAATASGSLVSPEKAMSSTTGLRPSGHLPDFDDTEVALSASYPALSATQYGDL